MYAPASVPCSAAERQERGSASPPPVGPLRTWAGDRIRSASYPARSGHCLSASPTSRLTGLFVPARKIKILEANGSFNNS